MEVTRTIQIQVTRIVDSKDIGAGTPIFIPKGYVEQEIREMFPGSDQVLVEVKDFIREEE